MIKKNLSSKKLTKFDKTNTHALKNFTTCQQHVLAKTFLQAYSLVVTFCQNWRELISNVPFTILQALTRPTVPRFPWTSVNHHLLT